MNENPHKDLARHRMDKAFRNLSIARENFHLGFYDEAVTKCYYAVITTMRAFLALMHLDSQQHDGVIKLFHQHFIKEKMFPREFTKIITELKEIREDADYGDYVTIFEEDAQEEIEHAEQFLRTADAVLAKLLSKKT